MTDKQKKNLQAQVSYAEKDAKKSKERLRITDQEALEEL